MTRERHISLLEQKWLSQAAVKSEHFGYTTTAVSTQQSIVSPLMLSRIESILSSSKFQQEWNSPNEETFDGKQISLLEARNGLGLENLDYFVKPSSTRLSLVRSSMLTRTSSLWSTSQVCAFYRLRRASAKSKAVHAVDFGIVVSFV
ncbi:unnamed protein product [Didymodactylos carnosus]|uniref:Uncharacterized protein n=1 Tax=Didymodactylos carnosus TaxID=1234261 RepID=A0A8S2MZ55_9BILA|nr:unnamed protein product [Didymodactylos carnosus]CAF3981993.1 unnamed protein product [Didymodactylos carnosus]